MFPWWLSLAPPFCEFFAIDLVGWQCSKYFAFATPWFLLICPTDGIFLKLVSYSAFSGSGSGPVVSDITRVTSRPHSSMHVFKTFIFLAMPFVIALSSHGFFFEEHVLFWQSDTFSFKLEFLSIFVLVDLLASFPDCSLVCPFYKSILKDDVPPDINKDFDLSFPFMSSKSQSLLVRVIVLWLLEIVFDLPFTFFVSDTVPSVVLILFPIISEFAEGAAIGFSGEANLVTLLPANRSSYSSSEASRITRCYLTLLPLNWFPLFINA